jgi:heptosyltransferase-3
MNRPDSPPSLLRGRYLVRNPGWNTALRVTDAVLSRVAQASRVSTSGSPSRILIAVGGHLGDAVIATSTLPVLTRAFPDASIGILLPSWSRPVVEGHPALRWIHCADHWTMSRADGSLLTKWRRYRSTASNAIAEISAVGYDVAIDLYAYYPNAARLLWRAGIPIRIGYESGGCGPLYTTALPWRGDIGHTAAQHARLIAELTRRGGDEETRYHLPLLSHEARQAARAATDVAGISPDRGYIVVHPGTGDPNKAWPSASWHGLVERLVASGEPVVVTGAGAADRPLAASLASRYPSVLNLVDRLDWPTFRAVVANAKAAIGPDSVAMHVAAAEHTPAIAIMAPLSDPEHWRPLGDQVVLMSQDATVNDIVTAYERLEVRVG